MPISPTERRRAISDLIRVYTQRRIWHQLAWVDIRSKYRLSTLGTFWITAAMAVLAVSIGVLYGQFFGQDMHSYLPYFATGYIIWGFISGTFNEASTSLVSYSNLIKGSQLPIVFHVLRVTQKQLIILAHNAIVILGIWLFFRWPLKFSMLLSFAGMALTFVFVAAISIVIAMMCVRFRDIPPLVQSAIQFLFFATPIMWYPESMRFGEFVLWANPLTVFLTISRDPFLDRPVEWHIWAVAVAMTAFVVAAAAAVYVRYRSRIAYWV
jgi:ABC-type polysaccharide/polyol phosphate export permease